MEQRKRAANCEFRRAGHNAAFIAKALKYPRQTVYDVCERFDESGQDQRAVHKRRSDRIRTPRFLAGLKRSIDANPNTPFSTFAKKGTLISTTTIHRSVQDLNLTTYAQGHRHILTNKMKEVRLERCRKVLKGSKSNGSVIRFSSDEKIFTVDRAFNRPNDWSIAFSAADVRPTMTTKYPASVMVLRVVFSKGDVFTHFFAERENENAEVYSNVLATEIIPWMKNKAAGKEFVYQQDSAPAHTARKTVAVLEREDVRYWDKGFWLSNSPDLNP